MYKVIQKILSHISSGKVSKIEKNYFNFENKNINLFYQEFSFPVYILKKNDMIIISCQLSFR